MRAQEADLPAQGQRAELSIPRAQSPVIYVEMNILHGSTFHWENQIPQRQAENSRGPTFWSHLLHRTHLVFVVTLLALSMTSWEEI